MRRRIVALASATALLAVLLLAVPLGIVAGRGYVKDERLEVEQAAVTAAASVHGDPTHRPAVRLDGGEIDVSVFDAHAARLTGPVRSGSAGLVRSALRGQEISSTTDTAIVVATPITDGDRVTGAVLLTTGLGAAHARALRAWLLLLLMGLAAVALSAVAARWIATRLAAPVGRLAATAVRIGEGDLSARAEASGVAELDTLGHALNDTAGRIQTMFARERGFSAEVSHQLRTPLSGLRLELEAVQRRLDRPGHPADAARGIERALRDVERLDATIAEVIRLARDLPGDERVGLRDLLADVERRWHGRLAESSRPLRVTIASGGTTELPLSAAAATQILEVLLDNAWTHGRGAVTVLARQDEHVTAIDVGNEGPPLADEPWTLFRAREPGAPHGLGLPYARRLAEAEGARLVVRSSDPPTFSLVTAGRRPASARGEQDEAGDPGRDAVQAEGPQ